MNRHEQQRADMARLAVMETPAVAIWHGARPAMAPAGTLIGPRGRTVDHDVYVLAPENFERAHKAIALCMAHGLMGPGK